MTDAPNRAAIPFRLNLEQQKKRARELLRALKAEEPAALARMLAVHPAAGRHRPGKATLADAQLVIARELGLASWPKLKEHVGEMERSRAAIAANLPAPDGDRTTLHVRCGSDIREALAAAGFEGDFLEYSDPVCQGPVPDAPDLMQRRARFLAEAYGKGAEFTFEQSLEGLADEQARLLAAPSRYRRVVLWMEHDSYDQLVLVRCLALLGDGDLPRELELISVNRFPGSARFIGIGQLPEEAIRMLWPRRRPVTPAAIALARQAWEALRAPDPNGLARLMRAGTPALPDLAGALHRHLRELPSVRDGLGLTERLVLEMLGAQSRTLGQLFRELMSEREPLPFLGDLMFLDIAERMGSAAIAPFETTEDDGDWPRRRLAISDAGRAVLAGERDWLSLGPPERWVGGVTIGANAPCWRWDDAAGRALMG